LYEASKRMIGADAAARELRKLLMLFDVTPVNRVVLESALMSKTLDFEDAVLYEAARHSGAEALVTRSFPAFKGAEVPVVTPERLLKVLSQKGRSHAEAWT
jgi:predicted nucleic acid-binding protein